MVNPLVIFIDITYITIVIPLADSQKNHCRRHRTIAATIWTAVVVLPVPGGPWIKVKRRVEDKTSGRRRWCEENTKWYQIPRLKSFKKTGELQKWSVKIWPNTTLRFVLAFFWGKYYSHAAEKHTYDPAALFKNSIPESLNEKRLLDQAAKESIWLLFRRWA